MIVKAEGDRGRGVTAFLMIVALCALLRLLYFVVEFGVNVPVADDWDLLQTVLSWKMDGFSPSSLFAFQHQDRIVTTRLIMGSLLPITDGNLKAAMLLNAWFVFLTLVGILLLFVRETKHPIYPVFAFTAIASLASGWFQWQNLIWSSQLPWLLLPLLLTFSIWSVLKLRSPTVCVTVVALLLLLSLGTQARGLVVWLAVVPALYFRIEDGSRARRSVCLGLFGLVILAAGWLYFQLVPPDATGPSTASLSQAPTRFVGHFIALLGSPFSAAIAVDGPQQGVGATLGSLAILLALAGIVPAWQQRRGHRSGLLALALGFLIFSTVSLGLVCLGPSPTSSALAFESRETTLAVYFHVGTLLLLYLVATRPRAPGRVTGYLRLSFLVGCCGLMVASTWGDRIFFQHGFDLRLAQERVKASLELSAALPDRPEISEQIGSVPVRKLAPLLDALESHDLWVPRRWVTRAPGDLLKLESAGTVDEVGMQEDGSVVLQGWARLPADVPADAILALTREEDGRLVVRAMSERTKISRTDVRGALDRESLLKSGWLLHMKRADYLQQPILAAYSASTNSLYAIPFIWHPVAN